MSNQNNMTFQEVLEMVETLPEYQREDLVNIIQHRLIEQKREQLAKNVKEARAEYARGEINKGTVDDLLRDLE